jgi:AAA15 family ATPase/GTPase
MLPTKIKVENYRSFEDRQRLDLRPLTLLFGKNNAGKSALLRALPIIGDSLSSKGMSPIDMDSPAVRGARFQDLKWRGEGRSATIDFRLEWEGKYIQSYEVSISYEENWNNRIAPRLINIETREKDFHLTCEFNEEEELEEIITFRDITNNSQERQLVNLNWSGMTPTCQKEGYADLFEALGTALEPMTGGVQWLTSARQAPERRSIPPGGASARLGPRGKRGCQYTMG